MPQTVDDQISSPLYARVREIVAYAWPEVLTHGIWEADHVDLVPYEELTAPYAVIAIDQMPSADWGATNDVYQPSIEIYYVTEVTGPLSGVRAKLETLRNVINAWSRERLQIQRVAEISWSQSLVPNAVFVSKGMSHRAGRLIVEVIAGAPTFSFQDDPPGSGEGLPWSNLPPIDEE